MATAVAGVLLIALGGDAARGAGIVLVGVAALVVIAWLPPRTPSAPRPEAPTPRSGASGTSTTASLGNARRGGAASLEAYEQLLENIADVQEAAGGRGAEWVASFGRAQAAFARELARSSPAAARRIGERISDVARGGARRARSVPGVETAEGETRGAVARQQNLPIARYDSLRADEVVKRLPKLSKVDLGKSTRTSASTPTARPCSTRSTP